MKAKLILLLLLTACTQEPVICGQLESGFGKIGIVKEENGELIFCDKDGCRPLTTNWERVPCGELSG